jgi:hypothetical protein
MAQIPTIAAPSLTPPPEINPSIAGRPGAAMAGAADQLGQVADFGLAVTERIKKAQDDGILLNAENQIAADIEKAHAGLANWTDYTHADEMKQQTADALEQKYSDLYGNRPDLWRYIQPYLGKELNSYNGIVDDKAADLTAHFNAAALYDSQLHAENEAANEPTLDGKEQHWSIEDSKIDVMVQNGTLWPLQGEQMKKQLRSKTIATEVDRAANPLNAPEIMEAEMARLKEYEGKGYVDPQKLGEMQDHLATAYNDALKRSENIDVSKQVDAIVTSMEKDPTLKDQTTGEFDYLKMAKQVDDNPDLPLKVKQHAREELDARDGLQKRSVNERDQKIYEPLDDRIGNPYAKGGPLTPAEVNRRRNLAPTQNGWIPSRVADHALNRIAQVEREQRAESTQQRMLLRQETEYNSAQLARELSATPGYIADESELYQGEYATLTRADRATVWAMKNVKGVKEYQDAYKMMSDSPVYPRTDEGNARLFADAAKLRNTVEQKKLTGSQIIDEATKILHPQEESQTHQTIKTLLDNIWPIAKGVITGQPVVPKVAPAVAPAQPNEGDTKTNSSGHNVVFKGGQWQLAR